MRAMLRRSISLLACLLWGCVSAPQAEVGQIGSAQPDDAGAVPEDLNVSRVWIGSTGGYIYEVGHFTPAQMASPAWEAARLAARKLAIFCPAEETVARRDVRWREPAATGEPSCARVVYTLTCSSKKKALNPALAYDREQSLLEEPALPAARNCGEKSRSNMQPAVVGGFRSRAIYSRDAGCEPSLSSRTDAFELDDVTYMNTQTIASRSVLQQAALHLMDGVGFLENAVRKDGKVHLVEVARPLPDDGRNLFVQKTYGSDREGRCISLAASQGDARWRKTVYFAETPNRAEERSDPADDAARLSELEKALQNELAGLLGIQIPSE
ncbi:hypothetical protein AAG612_13640 [Citromicrobium bathyomarinum]|uniref:hypothetical protein n=1 Tax=Citromicrobium bathyomarinum TaxID=72174 RepID=UPI003159AB34